MIIATPAKTAEWESRETPVVALATTAKAAQMARVAWTSTSVVETPVAMEEMATAAKTAEWARSQEADSGAVLEVEGGGADALMALVTLLPQLQSLSR